ncbi:MAG: sigma-E processing peptidase SpoIIGA [Clostridia bacterium]|nr:sigma-E processing peptidase SpoIIGA [Clostridia bacterium]
MEEIIYGDILFIINFSMDFLSIYITSKLLHAQTSISRLVFPSCLGALYGVISLFSNQYQLLSFAVNIIVAILICYIAFGYRNPLYLIRNTLIFYAVSFLLGGTMTALYSAVNRAIANSEIIIDGERRSLITDIPVSMFVIIALISVIFSYICSFILKKKAQEKTASLKIYLGNNRITLDALVDSGNLLREPAGGLCVAVCSYNSLEPLLPLGVRPLFKESKLGILEFADKDFAKKVRIIPVSHIGGKNILVGFIPDQAEVNGEIKKICIACTAETESFGDMECIIPAEIL